MKKQRTLSYYSGMSLLELLISAGLTALLLLFLTQFVTSTQLNASALSEKLQLQQELQRVAQLISKDLKRAGYRMAGANGANFHLFELENSSIKLNRKVGNHYQCVMFFYDLNKDGCLGIKRGKNACADQGKNKTKDLQTELFGYRLMNGMIETLFMYANAVPNNCSQIRCQKHLDNPNCESKGWTKLLDETLYRINKFELNWLENTKLPIIKLYLQGEMNNDKRLQYEVTSLIPLFNQQQ